MAKNNFFLKRVALNGIFSTFAASKMNGVWRSWLAYLHGVQGVGSSSLLTPTFLKKSDEKSSDFFCSNGIFFTLYVVYLPPQTLNAIV